jgi:hypothetical protein
MNGTHSRRELLVTKTRRPFLRSGLEGGYSRILLGLIAVGFFYDLLSQVNCPSIFKYSIILLVFSFFFLWFLIAISRILLTESSLILEYPFHQLTISTETILEFRVSQTGFKAALIRITTTDRHWPILGRIAAFRTNWGTFEETIREVKSLARMLSRE